MSATPELQEWTGDLFDGPIGAPGVTRIGQLQLTLDVTTGSFVVAGRQDEWDTWSRPVAYEPVKP